MLLKDLLRIDKYTVWKLLGAVVIFYLGMMWGISHIGEEDTMLQYDFVGDEISVSDASSKTHNASTSSYDTICDEYWKLCVKVEFSGKFSDKEKYKYFSAVVDLFDDLDSWLRKGKNLEKTLESLTLKSVKGDRRGNAGWTYITLNLGDVGDSQEFFEVLTHEMGHILDLGSLQGVSKKKHQSYTEFGDAVFAIDDPSLEYYKFSWKSEDVRQNSATKKDFCSGYGMSDPFEDFAECHNLYLNHNDFFKKLAKTNSLLKKKYNYFANVYGSKYFSLSPLDISEYSSSWRPWDTTRIEG